MYSAESGASHQPRPGAILLSSADTDAHGTVLFLSRHREKRQVSDVTSPVETLSRTNALDGSAADFGTRAAGVGTSSNVSVLW